VHVVRATPELDVLEDGLATGGVWFRMVEFQKATLCATAVRADERALTAIAFPDRSPHCSRNVTRSRSRQASRARSLRRGELGLFEIGHEQRQGPIKDRGWITVWNRVPQQILDATQLVVRLAGHGELHYTAICGRRPATMCSTEE
jgi:hypothetical protein